MAAKTSPRRRRKIGRTPTVPGWLRNAKPTLKMVERSIRYFSGKAREFQKLARALRSVTENGRF